MQDGNEEPPFDLDRYLGNQQRYREQVFDLVPAILVHRGGAVLYCNTGLVRLLGYEAVAQIRALSSVFDLIPIDDHYRSRAAFGECLAGSPRSELRRVQRRRHDGSIQWFEQYLEAAAWEGEPAVLETLAVVRSHAGFSELPHQWQRLQAAIDAMPNGVLMLDRDLVIEGMNSEFLRLWDYAPGLFPPGTPFGDMLRYNHRRGDYGDVERESTVAELLRRFEVKGIINAERYVPGGRILDIRTAPRADGGVVVTHFDITDRKRIENELRQAKERAETVLRELREAQQQLIVQEKMASLGQLTAGIAHELKNPLNFVNNFAELSAELLDELRMVLAQARGGLDDAAGIEIDDLIENLQRNMRKVAEHGKRADNIVKSMLAHSRGGGGERRVTDLNALVEESLALAYHAARANDREFNVSFDKRYDPAVGEIDIVPQDVSRVLLNIFTNGFYAVRKRQVDQGDPAFRPLLQVETKNCESNVTIRIRDNGIGMPPSVLEKIFTPFFTTKPTGEGTGLGLSLSYDIVVHQHRGRFEVSSVENAYAEFLITLPRTVPTVSLGERRKP